MIKLNKYSLWNYNENHMFISIFIMISLNILTLMTNNLINLWILMEINTFIFICYLTQVNKSISTTCIFFVIQSISSLIFLWLFFCKNFPLNQKIFNTMFFFTLSLKLGIFPFTWLTPLIMKKFNWMMLFSYSTLQKFIPLMILKNYFNNNHFFMLMTIILISMIISTMKAIYSNNLKTIMAFSSINNSCWLSILILIDFNMFLIYYISYSFILYLLTQLFKHNQINSFMNFSFFYKMNNWIYFYFIYLIFMLSMIPPMISFYLKLMTSMNLILNNLSIMTTMMMLLSSLSILMYINMFIKSLYFMNLLNKYSMKSNKIFNKINISLIYLFILPSFIIFTYMIF